MMSSSWHQIPHVNGLLQVNIGFLRQKILCLDHKHAIWHRYTNDKPLGNNELVTHERSWFATRFQNLLVTINDHCITGLTLLELRHYTQHFIPEHVDHVCQTFAGTYNYWRNTGHLSSNRDQLNSWRIIIWEKSAGWLVSGLTHSEYLYDYPWQLTAPNLSLDESIKCSWHKSSFLGQ